MAELVEHRADEFGIAEIDLATQRVGSRALQQDRRLHEIGGNPAAGDWRIEVVGDCAVRDGIPATGAHIQLRREGNHQ